MDDEEDLERMRLCLVEIKKIRVMAISIQEKVDRIDDLLEASI